jgi:hypothetical protein
MLAVHKVSPRAAQALMRHTAPRLTAAVYTDEKLLALAAGSTALKGTSPPVPA